ncbi:MAG: EGF domain-containing protein, partial [Archangium sp.]|nr:EGF domain-containing protein [Archangium sp.]
GCDSLASCTNTPGARTCGACPAGYTGTGETSCVDVDECAVSNGGCDSLASCTNTPGARTCGACPSGYTGTGETSCVDVDECASNNGGCDSLASCTNTPGARTCGNCPSGYTGSGDTTCVDVDECQMTNGGCDPLSVCTNTPGYRTCGACPSGYTGTGESICFDVDECAVSNGGCDSLASCTNTPGARTCGACPSGYTGDGETSCVDVDECASNNGGCDALASCTNTPGARTCGNCPSGYTGSGETTCVDVDECQMTNGGCDPLSVCTNTPGYRTCGACPSGYSGTGEGVCFNIDECAELTHDCHGDATCTDTVGSFTCACNAGFTGTGTSCEPITGCHVNGGGCDVNASCTGTGPTTNTCSCNQGYVGNGQTCAPPPVAAVTFRQAARWVGLNAGTVSIDVVRSHFHEGFASIEYTLSGACQKANQNGTLHFNHGTPWITLDLAIDPTCAVGDTLVVTLGMPSSNAAVTPVLGEYPVHTVNITAADPCTTEFPQLLVDRRDDLDIDGIPDRCDRSLAPAGKVSRFVAASSAVAGNAYGGNLSAANTVSVSVNGPPAAATHLFTHDWSPHWNDSGSWLTSQNELTQWFTVSFAGPVTVDEFSMINFSHTNRNLEWMRGVKDFRLYGSNTIATPPGTRASAEPSMVLLGSYTALSANDRSWMQGGQVKGLPQVFRVNSSTQYQYYHFEFTTSQRTDWTGHYPGDLTGLRRIEFARYVDDGCLVNHGGCDSNATCRDVQGQIDCTCSVGFYGEGETCAVLAQDPRSISGLEVWVAADVGLEMNGSTVATWQDLSGHRNHFRQTNPNQQPTVAPGAIGGRPALQFQAAQSQFMGLPGSFTGQTSICYVARIFGPTSGRVLSSLSSNWLMGWWNGAMDMAHYEEWVYSSGFGTSMETAIYCGVMTGTSSSFYRNGQLLGTNTNGRGPEGLCIGGYNGGSEFSDAQVAELLVYRAALSPAQIGEVNSYLAAKYPSCTDGVHNGAEVDIDCGGGCGTCADNKMCTTHGDCTNGVCDAESMTCGPPGVRTYDFDGLEHSLVLPAGRTINVKVWGAGGQNSGYTSLGGGAGGFTSGQLVGSGQMIKLSVGRGATNSTAAFGGGGRGGTCGPSGGGGGLSKVALANGTLLFVAGGGGGAGPGQGAYGGGGCGLSGGGTGVAVGGQGGTLTSGFAPFLGEDADNNGAAGGGGYFGGAKGSGPACDVGGGGGGGSCFIAPSVIAPLQLAAAGTTPSTDTSAWVRGNAGQGGVGYYEAGANGRVVISWKTGVSCSVDNGRCDVNATCTESGQGTVSCACNSGYGGDGSRCVDITAPPVANLSLWVAADRGLVMNGSTVSGWLDQSGNGNDFVQGEGYRQPVVDPTGISGRPALQFNANSAQTLIMGTNLPAPVTVCYVARISGPSHQRVLSGLYNNWLLGWHGDHSDRAYFEGWIWFGSPSINFTPVSYCTVISTTSSTLSRNGVQLAEGFGGFQGPNGLSVVGSGGNSEFSDAQVAEILVYGAALSGAERAHVETYLTSKYGL